MRKAHFWGFPETLSSLETWFRPLKCHSKNFKIDQIMQTRNPEFSLYRVYRKSNTPLHVCFKMYLNQFQIVSSTLGNQTATILMIFRVRKSNFGSPNLKFHIFSVKYWFLLCHLIGRYRPPRQLEISRKPQKWAFRIE